MGRLDITTTVGCSVQCRYCPQEAFVRAYRQRSKAPVLTLDAFKTMLPHIPKSTDLIFAGFSEPWLNPDCTQLIQYAYQEGYKNLHFSTTLVGMTTEDINVLEDIPFKEARIHLPSSDRTENISVDEKYLNVLGRFMKSRIKAVYRYHGRDLHPQIRSVLGAKASRILTLPRSVSVPDAVDVRNAQKKRGILTCTYDSSLHFNELLPNGDVLLCCNDWSMRNVLGNLLEQDYESLFQGEVFLRIQKELKDKASGIICRHCLISRPAALSWGCFSDLWNTDVRIIACLAFAVLGWLPFFRNRFSRKLLRRIGLTKTKIALGYWTLND